MKCKICGAESGKYPLCRACNIKKEKGEIIKCTLCGNWHAVNSPCINHNKTYHSANQASYLYDTKKVLISNSEQIYYKAILSSLPNGYYAFPQVNLASFIVKNDDSPFHNELFRNVDFLVTNERYSPLFIIEINDRTHLNPERKERDEKVQKICEEAGIPIVKFWTSFGVNEEYIKNKIHETLSSIPIARVHHFVKEETKKEPVHTPPHTRSYESKYHRSSRRRGCYVATCVYGSYDCPQVWTLRRYRDTKLASSWHGKLFIKTYYLISPALVKLFGKSKLFHKVFRPMIDSIVHKLIKAGYESTPYIDRDWI